MQTSRAVVDAFFTEDAARHRPDSMASDHLGRGELRAVRRPAMKAFSYTKRSIGVYSSCLLQRTERRMQVIAYLRVSTADQGRSGLGLEAQRAAIADEAQRRGWEVVEWITDEASGKSLNREGIQHALTRLENGGPKVLVAAKLDRIARSAIDFLSLIERAEAHGWALILLEPNVDMTDPMGRFTAGVLAQVAQLERELIAKRTKDALQVARDRGVRLGRPRTVPDTIVQRITRERGSGQSLQAIANGLANDGVPTARGGRRWYPSTVAAVLRSVELDVAANTASGR